MADVDDVLNLKVICAGSETARARSMANLDRAYRAEFERYFRRNLRGQERAVEAGDIVQETMLKIFAKACSFRGESKAASWLWAVARNTLIETIRAITRNHEQSLSDSGWNHLAAELPNDADTSAAHDQMRIAVEALRELDRTFPERAEVIRRAVIEDWSTADLATFLGKKPGATREFLSQTRKRYRQLYQAIAEKDPTSGMT